ncbi:myb-interacting protein 40 [Haematobia irritans]|uniref:myb-interacting protein 40 n=1 Tax=Haematobia irritans TaxID=7368 RepID=UPI003F501E82
MKTPPQKRKLLPDRGKSKAAFSDDESIHKEEVDDIDEDYEEEEDEPEEPPPPPPVTRPTRGRPRKTPAPVPQPEKTNASQMGIMTPYKRRKKERELSSAGHNKIQAESFVMKLFDRTLDLSKYTEFTELYPICRAWMANQPRNPSIRSYRETRSPSPVHRENDGLELLTQLKRGKLRSITRMPKPKEADMPRVAPQVEPNRYTSTDELIASDDPLQNASKEKLLKQHISKWKHIKSGWQKHTKRYQRRYDVNFVILQELFQP